MIVGIVGALVGEVQKVQAHPQGTLIWLADVSLGDNIPTCQIVFGGDRRLTGGELVPVAPPGSRAVVRLPDASQRSKKMRTRRYRGERSYGMLCSLDELGWIDGGPNEVAVLRRLKPGQRLDELPADQRPVVVKRWKRAERMAKRKWRRSSKISSPRFVRPTLPAIARITAAISWQMFFKR